MPEKPYEYDRVAELGVQPVKGPYLPTRAEFNSLETRLHDVEIKLQALYSAKEAAKISITT